MEMNNLIFINNYKSYFYNTKFRHEFATIEKKNKYKQVFSILLDEKYNIEMREYLPPINLNTSDCNKAQMTHKIIYDDFHINNILYSKKQLKRNAIFISAEGIQFFNELYSLKILKDWQNMDGILNLFDKFNTLVGIEEYLKKEVGCAGLKFYIDFLQEKNIGCLNKMINNWKNTNNVFNCIDMLMDQKYNQFYFYTQAEIQKFYDFSQKLLHKDKNLNLWLFIENIRLQITQKNMNDYSKMVTYAKYIISKTIYSDHAEKILKVLHVFIENEYKTSFFKICSLLDFLIFTTFISKILNHDRTHLSTINNYYCKLFKVTSVFDKSKIDINYFYNTYFLYHYRKYVSCYKKVRLSEFLRLPESDIGSSLNIKTNDFVNVKIGQKCEMKNKNNALYAFSPIKDKIRDLKCDVNVYSSRRKIKFD